MTLMEFSMFPMDKGVSVSKYVAQIINIIDKSGLNYKTGAMGTTVEGEWPEVMNLLGECHDQMAKLSDRVYATVKLDTRKETKNRLTGKIESIETHLGHRLK